MVIEFSDLCGTRFERHAPWPSAQDAVAVIGAQRSYKQTVAGMRCAKTCIEFHRYPDADCFLFSLPRSQTNS